MTEGSSVSRDAPARVRRKDDRPGEIIAAGLAVFGEHGFERARMEDVARRAGVAKGTVFRYFPTKEALFEAALISRISPVFDGLAAMVERPDASARELLGNALDAIYAQIARPELSALMRAIIAEGPRFPAILESYHRLSISRGQAVLARIVERGIESGEMRRGAVADLPMIIMAPAIMTLIWQATFGLVQPVPPERFKAAHLELLDGLLARPAGP
ncbi:TetR/AcrR family transcriptional regulator [Roseomonas sp. CCTCC AB2023176]|uniref:TetR/AcrR family transcriptional regulator n=1 Tax=Roseomonas sp. CCTCC AB2023176 TaxID=3342640 RepID=UPI0035DA7716